MTNADTATVDGFGAEWARYDQSGLSEEELRSYFSSYFSVFPWHLISKESTGFDLGCGSGRWANFVAPRVKKLYCIDASAKALDVARRNLTQHSNCEFHCATVDCMAIADDSMDFGYSLGVLHHVPDTAGGLRSCVKKLKTDAPFLVYLYYRFDNKPTWYRQLWEISNQVRQVISRLPDERRIQVTRLIAAGCYWPLARTASLAARLGLPVHNFPLAVYRDSSFYTMATDALDRFGTRLEQRFTRAEIEQMMLRAGLDRIEFSDGTPYWCAVGYRVR